MFVRRNMNRPGDGIEREQRRRGPASGAPAPRMSRSGAKSARLRLQRGLSQSGLADGIGLTFQQVQKYEKGTNRVSAGRLQKIADMLNIPVTFFYGGMGAQAKQSGATRRARAWPFCRPRARCGW